MLLQRYQSVTSAAKFRSSKFRENLPTMTDIRWTSRISVNVGILLKQTQNRNKPNQTVCGQFALLRLRMLPTNVTRSLTQTTFVPSHLTCACAKRLRIPRPGRRRLPTTLRVAAKGVQFTLRTPTGQKQAIQKVTSLAHFSCCLFYKISKHHHWLMSNIRTFSALERQEALTYYWMGRKVDALCTKLVPP